MVNVNVRFPNLSQAPRTEIAYAALPFAQGEWDGTTPLVLRDAQEQLVDSHIEPLGARWPDGSVRYGKLLARVSLGPNETKQMVVTEGTPQTTPFVIHESLLASAGNIAMTLRIKVNGQWASTNLVNNLLVLEDNRLRKVIRSRERIGNFVVDVKVYLMSQQQLVKFELSVTGSNPANTLLMYPFEEIQLVVNGNCYVNIRGAARRGVTSIVPYKEFRLMANDYFGDGQKQSWYGEIFPQLDFNNMDQVSNAISSVQYVLYGMSPDWKNKDAYAALGVVQQPDNPNINNHWTQLVQEFHQYYNFVNSQGGPWDDYLLGVTATPGQTGAQADFGNLEAGAVLHMGAAELLDMLYFMATEETKRPGHYFEVDTREVTSVTHPNWVAWAGQTHWHTVVSPDRLGKTGPNLGNNHHGWFGKDAEHWSSNLLSLASLMTGSYLLLDEVNTEIELYLAEHTIPSMKPGWSTNGRGAPRAFGRTHHAMCNHYLLTGRQDLVTRMLARFTECVLPNWDGATRSPVRNWSNTRDDRVLGSTIDAWVPWNESLGFVGAVALYNVTRNSAVKEMLIAWGNTLLNYGWHADFMGSTIVNLSHGGGVRWFNDGHALVESQYHDPLFYVPAGGGLILWGVQVLEVIRNNPQVFGEENANKASMYAQYMRAQHTPQPNVPFSEFGQWLAIKLMP